MKPIPTFFQLFLRFHFTYTFKPAIQFSISFSTYNIHTAISSENAFSSYSKIPLLCIDLLTICLTIFGGVKRV